MRIKTAKLQSQNFTMTIKSASGRYLEPDEKLLRTTQRRQEQNQFSWFVDQFGADM
ncbi:hypothetical protein LP7551_01251 [Roseibium album]|nr:hypothetical protein LP7551_01251 [Roseibium album]